MSDSESNDIKQIIAGWLAELLGIDPLHALLVISVSIPVILWLARILWLAIKKKAESLPPSRLARRLRWLSGVYNKPCYELELEKNNLKKSDRSDDFRLSGLPFIGREAELKALELFVCGSLFSNEDRKQLSNFSWWAIVGHGGSGKSRLALELCRSLERSPSRLKTGFLTPEDLKKKGWREWRPRCRTLIVVDDLGQHRDTAKNFIDELFEQQNHYDFPVRVLVLERTEEDVNRILDFNNAKDSLYKLNKSKESNEQKFLTPSEFKIEQAVKIVRSVLGNSNVHDDEIKSRINSIDPDLKRSLIFVYIGEFLKNNPTAQEITAKDLLDTILNKERNRIKGITGEGHYDQYEKLLWFITLTGTLETNEISQEIRKCIGLAKIDLLKYSEIVSKPPSKSLTPLQPILLGDFFLIKYWNEQSTRFDPNPLESLCHIIWSISPEGLAYTLYRIASSDVLILTDEERSAFVTSIIDCAYGCNQEIKSFSKAKCLVLAITFMLQSAVKGAGFSLIDKWVQKLQTLYEESEQDKEIRVELAKALVNQTAANNATFEQRKSVVPKLESLYKESVEDNEPSPVRQILFQVLISLITASDASYSDRCVFVEHMAKLCFDSGDAEALDLLAISVHRFGLEHDSTTDGRVLCADILEKLFQHHRVKMTAPITSLYTEMLQRQIEVATTSAERQLAEQRLKDLNR